VSREVDLEAIDQFLTYEYIIAPRTIFKHIHKLPAAHYLRYRDGESQVRRYWDAADVPVRAWAEPSARDAVRETLAERYAAR
jgi:asparagine synthase (glutamine-hydrolysing)